MFRRDTPKYYRCVKCASGHVTNNRIEKKRKLVELYGGKCIKCGYSKYIGALEFHHRNPKEKKFAISGSGLVRSMEALIKEAGKCDMLCSNCHKEIENHFEVA